MNHAVVNQSRTQRGQRRVYGRDFKLQVVQKVEQGLQPFEVVQDLDLSHAMVLRWIREWRRDPAHAFRGRGRRNPVQQTLEQLRREVRKLQAEKVLLKKASARFALNPKKSSALSRSIEQSGRLDGCASYSMSRQADITTG